MKRYKYYQPNRKDIKDEMPDDVVRAFAKVFNIPWVESFDILAKVAREKQCMLFCKECYEEVLKGAGFTYTGISNKRGSVRPTVESFSRNHKKGVYVVVIAHNIVPIIDGVYYNTWDCGEKSLYGYWEAGEI